MSERAGLPDRELRRSDKLAATGHCIATHVTGNSHSYLEAMCNYRPALVNKSSVINNSIGTEFFSAFRNSPAIVRDTTGSDSLRLVVVSARPCAAKGLFILLAALAKLKAGGTTGFTLDWIGPNDPDDPNVDSTDINAATAQIKDLNLERHWHWRGPQVNLHEHYPNYHALITPSLHEGVANVMCEAMACGVPIIATRIADNELIVEHNKQGILCQPDNADDLHDSIAAFSRLTENEKHTMSSRAHKRATELFEMSRIIDQWESLVANIKNKS